MLYRFAQGSDEQILDIEDLNHSTRRTQGPYRCLGCGTELVPVLGQRVEHHFRHKHQADRVCSGETYLHRTAKLAIAEAFQAAIENGKSFPLVRERNVTCSRVASVVGQACEYTERQGFDLTKWLTTASVEAEIQGFVADVLLRGEKDALLIEVVVTHPCSPEKIASGLKIIEIRVESDEDIARLRNGFYVDGEKTVGYNLRPAPESKTTNCQECKGEAAAFIIYQSGKVILLRNFADQVAKTMQRVSVMHTEAVSPKEFQQTDPLAGSPHISILDRYVQKAAFELGLSFKNCLLCRHGDFTWDWIALHPMHCFKGRGLNGNVGVNEAVSCPQFERYHSLEALQRSRAAREE